MSLDLFPIVEFRPLPGYFVGGFRRYAEGKWLPDDGEYDLAFVSDAQPTVLYFDHSYQRNIVTQWLDGDWRASEPRHPRGNPWHYVLREGETEWGGPWGRERHPNYLAGRAGMNECCRQFKCANGHGVTTEIGDRHVAAGLVRERDTKRIVTFPDGVCMYCGDRAAHAIERIGAGA